MRVDKNFNSMQHQQSSSGGIKLPFVTVIAIIALAVGFFIGYNKQDLMPNVVIPGELNYTELEEVYDSLKQNYDGELDTEALIEGAKKGLVSGVGDDHTQYFTAEESEAFLNDLEGSFEGIGAELGNHDGKLTIISVIDGSPAAKSGLKANDVIAKVDDTDTLDWQPEAAVQIIRGEKGTQVKLTVVRGGEVKDFTITRDQITDPSVKWEITSDNIGIIRISRFSNGDTSTLANKAAQEFKAKNVRGIVLDLRGNSGGYVDTAQTIAGLWLKSGSVIVSERQGGRTIETLKATGNTILQGIPTIVLIDGGSASASEIVAGALQDHGTAKLVGTKSYGKGSVQTMVTLSNGAELKVTIAKWYTPNGKNIDKEGINPDHLIEFDGAKYEQGIDVQKNKALDLLNNK